MGFETDAFEKLDQELEEELRQRNFHLAKDADSLMFERKLTPAPSWLFASSLFNLLGLLVLIYLLNYFLTEIISTAKDYYPGSIPTEYEKYARLGILLFGMFVSLKIFSRRIIGNLYSFFYLRFTEYIITNSYIYLRSKAGFQRGRIIPLGSISSIITRQSILERIFGVGDIVIQLKTGQNFYIHSVTNHEEIAKELILMLKREDVR
jgi:uncharacterized membrane protein YdbT with pleckstrin-like domain